MCVDNDPVYIVMELMPGGDLLKFLREAKMDHVSQFLLAPATSPGLLVVLMKLSLSSLLPLIGRGRHC